MEFDLSYIDIDGDEVSLSREQDFNEALRVLDSKHDRHLSAKVYILDPRH